MEVLHRDEALVAVDKPSGLVVHRSERAGDRDNCMRRLRDALGEWVYPVHRLDRGASGVLLFALDPESARRIGECFARRTVRKRYLAIVRGYAPESALVDHPLGAARGATSAAQTRIRRLGRVELPAPVGRYATARYSLVCAQPLTGRTHQLRRHLAHVSHPIIGDVNHGDGAHNRFFRDHLDCRRLLLHAHRLVLPHPTTGERVTLRAPVTGELAAVMARLGWGAWLPAAPSQGGQGS
jgi:tRNA pseudouridine65 synthase